MLLCVKVFLNDTLGRYPQAQNIAVIKHTGRRGILDIFNVLRIKKSIIVKLEMIGRNVFSVSLIDVVAF